MPDKRHLVVTVFDDQARATAAVEWLKKLDKTNKDVDDIRFGAMAVLTADKDREIKIKRVGKRDIGSGTGVGLVIGALAGALTAGIGLIGGLAAGALAGGVGGGLIHKGLGMHQGDLVELTDQLCSGRAAVALVVPEPQVKAVTEQLIDLGGSTKVYECSPEALEE
ncbi:MAG: hypothetical protein JW990_09950 [Thermoleophilia bacterium]|nr:hypothetical protein [Thermoleophilia bacterium]